MIGSIYFVINKITGKYYIGRTTQKVLDRWRDHKRFSIEKRQDHYFSRAIRKYGPESFEVRTIFICYDEKTLSEAEQYFIKLFSSNNRTFGYNSTPGGEGYSLSKEHRKKIGLSNLGKKRSQEFCERMKSIAARLDVKEAKSRAWKGKKRGSPSPEHRAKNAAAKTGKRAESFSKIKMSLAQYVNWAKRKGKTMSVNCVTLLGRLGKDPELRSTTSGKSVVSFSLAVDDGWGDKRKTNWFTIEAWDKTAEAVARLATAGKRIAVVGSLQEDTWTDQKSGEKRSRTKILASRVDIIDFAEKNQGDGQGQVDDDDIPF
jgi:single-strand DNA-binding protein